MLSKSGIWHKYGAYLVEEETSCVIEAARRDVSSTDVYTSQ